MTKERKIEILKDLLIQLSDSANILCTCEADERCEVVEECIKALEQQPSEDCISRADVFQMIKAIQDDAGGIIGYYTYDRVKNLPSVTPIRKKGEWCKQNDDYFDWYECSECGYGSEGEIQYSSECDVRTKFCPNCGAEMEGNNEIN